MSNSPDTRTWTDKFVDWIPCGSTLHTESFSPYYDAENQNTKSGLTKNNMAGIISCFGDQRNDDLADESSPIKDIDGTVLMKIFGFLNHGDLLRCRLVQKEWNFLISVSDMFLNTTVYCLSTDAEVGLQVFGTFTPYRNTRFLYIDYEVYLKKADFDQHYSQNYFFHPSQRFLQNIKCLECRQCFITWETLKRILASTQNLEHLIISQCVLSNETSAIASLENAVQNTTFRDVLGNLKRVSIFEQLDLDTINKILGKLLSFSSRFLEEIIITYKPRDLDAAAEDGDVMTFCHSLLHIIQGNAPTLKNITLELDDEIIVNRIPALVGKLGSFWKTLKLKTFSLNSSSSAKITHDSSEAVKLFIKFFQSQKDLTHVAIPMIETTSSETKDIFTKLIETVVPSLPPTLKSLNVPSINYVNSRSIMQFSSLDTLCIGSQWKESISINRFFDLSSSYYDEKIKSVWRNLKHLTVPDYSGENIGELLVLFPQLTSLKISAGDKIDFQDSDFQSLIIFLPTLQSLSLANLDNVTDYGISGVPLDVCKRMRDLETHITFQNAAFTCAILGNGKPLSHLKGLRSLSLEGKSCITDFGINFGIRFLELKYIRLPWSIKVTEWGIRRLATQNPSLEKVDLCGVNKLTLDAFSNLAVYNARIKKNLCSYDTFYDENPDLPNMIDKATKIYCPSKFCN